MKHSLKISPTGILWLFLSLILLTNSKQVSAAFVPVGMGGYETTLPSGQKGPSNQNGQPVTPKVTSTFSLPPLTNSWWSSLIWQNDPAQPWSQPLFAHPLAFQANQNGLGVSYPTAVAISPYTTTSKGHKIHEYHYNYTQDFLVGIAGLNAPSTKVANYSDWSVTASWVGNGRTLEATIGKGFPFAYFTGSGDAAQIKFSGVPNIWYNQGGIVGLTINGHNYGIFGPAGSTWTYNQTLSSTLNGKNFFSIAVLPNNTPQTLNDFASHAYAFPTKTTVAWTYDAPAGKLNTTYTVATTLKEGGVNRVNVPLLALYRHQWLNTSSPFTAYTYVSPRGTMKVVNASTFKTSLTYNGVLPALPFVAKDQVDTFSTNTLYGYVDAIYRQSPIDRWNGITVGDTYWFGKAIGKISHLIQIANQVNHTAAKTLFLTELKARLQDWFDGKSPQLFYYDSAWKTLIGYPASYGSDQQLNDHQFHYGYFIVGAATVAQFDPSWAVPNQWGGMVEMLIKDVSNWDKVDTRFPFLRCFDPYEGHGWANGSQLFAAGNNLESSSESTNYSAALILWGSLTNNPTLRDLGVYLYRTEQSAIEQYWFDIDKAVFPYAQGWVEPTLGMVWGNGGAYAIWWDGAVQELHGINFIPINGGSLYLGQNPDYLKANQQFMMSNAGTLHPLSWIDIHMEVKAFYDPKGAISQFNANKNYTPEAGESKAHTYYWIHNLNRLGRVEKTVTADIATAAVFNQGASLAYVAFNPTSKPITVTFSNGTKLAVEPYQIANSINQAPPPPQDHGFLQGASDINNGTLQIWFKPNQPAESVKLNYQINGGTKTTVALTQGIDQWNTNLTGLVNNDVVVYSFTYVQGGATYQSDPFTHTYKGSEVPPDGDDGFNQSTQELINGRLQFTFTPDQPSTFVDLHYKINGGGQLNVRMQESNGSWTYVVYGLNPKDVVDYYYTFFTTQGVDSKWFQHTYQGGTPPPPSEDFAQKVEVVSGNRILVTFIPKIPQEFVILNYQITGQKPNRALMTFFDGNWIATIPNLLNGNQLNYTFSYFDGETTKESNAFTYQYVDPMADKMLKAKRVSRK